LPALVHSQTDQGIISGNIELFSQYYLEDDQINATVPEWTLSSNSFSYINYQKGAFGAGVRFEGYLNPLLSYPVNFQGTGLGYRYVTWQREDLDVTLGNFYEQFGSGLVLRSYEERLIGIDNALDGLRLRYRPTPGMTLTGFVAEQRFAFDDRTINGNGVLRGFDAQMNMNELLKPLAESKTLIDVAGSVVSKYNNDNNTPNFNLPKNVAAFSGRLDVQHEGWRFNGEYTWKSPDPYPIISAPEESFEYLYKNGEALLLNLGYSTKGLAIDFTARHVDNMLWRSTNAAAGPTDLLIGFIPSPTKQHTYNLATTLYPYQTNFFGEVSYRGDVIYKIPKKTQLGGKYGMTINASYTEVYSPERTFINDAETDREGYRTSILAASDSAFVKDLNIELKKKWSKELTTSLAYLNFYFDDRVNQIAVIHEVIEADILALEILWKLKKKKALRFEFQHLWTEDDQQDWAYASVEYTIAPHWSFTLLDQYNYGNEKASDRFHYALGNVAYVKGPHRFSLQYGRQRAGFFCVGGICRPVPASNGFSLAVSSSF